VGCVESCVEERLDASSQEFARTDMRDPALGEWYVDRLVEAVMDTTPIGASECYLATNLRRHLDARTASLQIDAPRLEPALASVRQRLAEAGHIAERIENALGQLVSVSGIYYRRFAARELTRCLELLREHLMRAREEELDMAMRASWEDIGGSG
jgi:hypothetical protein